MTDPKLLLKSLILTLVILLLMSSSATESVQIFPPADKPYGLTYEEHIKNFWRWQISIPRMPQHPMLDKTGNEWSKCQSNPMLSVVFLSGAGGKKVRRKCRIPAGKSILIPVMTMIATDREYPGSTQVLYDTAKQDQDNVTALSLDINGKKYAFDDLKKFRTATGEFEVEFPKDGIFRVRKEGRSKAVADGYYLLTEPLKPDTYTIHYKGAIPSANFHHDIDYTLIVK
jgi:hypothetical protein